MVLLQEQCGGWEGKREAGSGNVMAMITRCLTVAAGLEASYWHDNFLCNSCPFPVLGNVPVALPTSGDSARGFALPVPLPSDLVIPQGIGPLFSGPVFPPRISLHPTLSCHYLWKPVSDTQPAVDRSQGVESHPWCWSDLQPTGQIVLA